MKRLTDEELKNILDLHERWLCSMRVAGKPDGVRADLSNTDLSDLNLSGVNLEKADLHGAILCHADLSNANFENADLSCADLRAANLEKANLSGVKMSYAKLSGMENPQGTYLNRVNLRNALLIGADLYGSDLSDANLNGANLAYCILEFATLKRINLQNTDLRGTRFRMAGLWRGDLTNAKLNDADFWEADLTDAIYDKSKICLPLQCPEEGSFIGYKKSENTDGKPVIVKLQITEDAKRSSATSRKCRCNKAKVLSITSIEGETEYDSASCLDLHENFIYKVGETVEVTDFDEDRWNECSTGIHFFITRDEAVQYKW